MIKLKRARKISQNSEFIYAKKKPIYKRNLRLLKSGNFIDVEASKKMKEDERR